MIPILYEKTETEFASNGLGRLRDCAECTVVEERNGIYECDFSYPVNGMHYPDIQVGRIIAVEHNEAGDVQPFDIVSCTKPINGMVSFHAVHISYRQSKMTARGTNINNIQDAFAMLLTAVPSNPFLYDMDDISATGYMASANGVPHSVREFLGGIEGSILDTYRGEYEWDKFKVILHTERGVYRDFTIRYGVNLVDYAEEHDELESYTAVVPYWTGSDDNGNEIIVAGSMQNSGMTTSSGRTECIPLDVTDKFEEQPTQAQVEAMGRQIMNETQPYLPARNIKVDFVRLQESGEYEQFDDLLRCDLCDSVRVVFPLYNMDGWFKIVKVTYDVLQERYLEMELGTLQTTLAEALGINFGSSESAVSDGKVKDIVVEQGTDGIWTYRKWASGICEAWGRTANATYAQGNTWGNAYYTSTSVNLPSGLFTSVKCAHIDRNDVASGLVMASIQTVSTSAINFYVVDTNSGQRTCSFGISVLGTWK